MAEKLAVQLFSCLLLGKGAAPSDHVLALETKELLDIQ